MIARNVSLAVLLAFAAGCGQGSKGSTGDTGPAGPQGPLGPSAAAPHIQAVSPTAVADGTRIRVRGTGFGSSPTVYVNGVAASVDGATDTEIWATVAVDASNAMADVTVVSNHQVSNAVTVEVAQASDYWSLPTDVPFYPGAVVLDPEEQYLYVADLIYGLYKMSVATGEVERITYGFATDYLPGALRFGADGKLYMASYNLWMGVSRLERIDGYGQTTLLNQFTSLAGRHIAWDPNGDLFISDLAGRIFRLNADDNTLEQIFSGAATVGMDWADGALHAVLNNGQFLRFDVTQDPVTNTLVTNITNPRGAVSDGVNFYVVVNQPTRSVLRVAPDGSQTTIAGPNGFPSNMTGAYDVGVARSKAGDIYYPVYPLLSVVKVDKSGQSSAWFTHPAFSAGGTEVGGDYYTGSIIGCGFAGTPSTLVRLSAEGRLGRVAEDVCVLGDTLKAHNGMLIAADARGWIASIDPVSGTQTVISADPNIASPQSLAVAANGDLFVGLETGSGEGRVVKISADGGTVDPSFLSLSYPAYGVTVVDDTLYVTQETEIVKVPVAGGTPTAALASAYGFEDLYVVGPGPAGTVLFTDDEWGSGMLDTDGDVFLLADDYPSSIFIDSFNRLTFSSGGFYGVYP